MTYRIDCKVFKAKSQKNGTVVQWSWGVFCRRLLSAQWWLIDCSDFSSSLWVLASDRTGSLRTAAHISMSWVLCYCTWPLPCTRSMNKACHLSADDCFEQQTDIRGEVRSTDQAVQWGLTEINSCRWSHGNIDLSFSITNHWSIRTNVIKKYRY